MYHKHHTKGIVLKGLSEGVNDRRVGILTESLGLVWARARSARTTSSKLRSGCQDFAYGEFSFVSGKTGWRLVGARVETNFFEVCKESGEKIITLANVFALLRKLLTGEEANPALFGVVNNFLQFLGLAKPEEVAPLEWLTLAKILHLLGFLREDPELAPLITLEGIEPQNLSRIAPRRAQLIRLINESLKEI